MSMKNYITTFKFTRKFSSINNGELSKFSKIGSDWWDASSKAGTGPLHYMNQARISFIRENVSILNDKKALPILEQLKGIKILDIGCGGGLVAESLARLGADVSAIDPSEENIRAAKLHSSLDPLTKNIRYYNQSVESMSQSSEKFDVVCVLEVIEHVDDTEQFIKSCLSCLKPESQSSPPSIFFSTINRTLKSYALAIISAEYILGLIPPKTHNWNKFKTPRELEMSLHRENFSINRIQGIIPSFVNSIQNKNIDHKMRNQLLNGHLLSDWVLSDNDLDVNYIFHAAPLKNKKDI